MHTMTTEIQNRRLIEVDLIRIVLISLLILYHSFAPWCGSWSPFEGYIDNGAFYWIGSFSYSFFLECFVFVSGYTLGFQVIRKGKNLIKVNPIVTNKAKRLLLPSIVFSTLYLLSFGLATGESVGAGIYSLLEGRAHMWFLPMLFWCFLFLSLIEYFAISKRSKIIIIALLLIFGVMPLPLRLGSACYYFAFFYLGYYFKLSFKEDLLRNWSLSAILLCLLSYVLIFIFSETSLHSWMDGLKTIEYRDSLHNVYLAVEGGGGNELIVKIIAKGIERIVKFCYSLLGVIVLLSIALKISSIGKIKNYLSVEPNSITKLSGACFGIYLVQQFILIYIYYHTSFSTHVSNTFIPWVASFITLILSIGVTCFIQKFKIGRMLIG